jgi:hypothetical protein
MTEEPTTHFLSTDLVTKLRATLAETVYRPASRHLGRFASFGHFSDQNRTCIAPLTYKTDAGACIQPASTIIFGGRSGRCGL